MARGRAPKKELLSELESRIDLLGMLTDEEKAETKKRAREHVEKERKNKAIDDLFKREVRAAEVEHLPNEQIMDIQIDLPPFAAMVRLDNVVFFHGLVYEVTMSQWSTIRDAMARAWEHQAEIEGKSRTSDATRRHMTTALSPNNPQGTRLNTLDQFRSI